MGGAGDDLIHGGAGRDTAAFLGDSAGYTVEHRGRAFLVTEVASGDVDTLYDIERLAFDDATLDIGLFT
jgi:hypothetical protein